MSTRIPRLSKHKINHRFQLSNIVGNELAAEDSISAEEEGNSVSISTQLLTTTVSKGTTLLQKEDPDLSLPTTSASTPTSVSTTAVPTINDRVQEIHPEVSDSEHDTDLPPPIQPTPTYEPTQSVFDGDSEDEEGCETAKDSIDSPAQDQSTNGISTSTHGTQDTVDRLNEALQIHSPTVLDQNIPVNLRESTTSSSGEDLRNYKPIDENVHINLSQATTESTVTDELEVELLSLVENSSPTSLVYHLTVKDGVKTNEGIQSFLDYFGNVSVLKTTAEEKIPRFRIAIQDKGWNAAMCIEMNGLEEKKVITKKVPYDPRVHGRQLSSKWVLTLKTLADGTIIKKARVVVRGFEQELSDTAVEIRTQKFSPTLKPSTLLTILNYIVCIKKFKSIAIDISQAFLHGKLTEEIAVVIHFPDGELYLCTISKALYGLIESPKVWYYTLTDRLQEMGFTVCATDMNVFTRRSQECVDMILVFVDDLLVFSTGEPMNVYHGLAEVFATKVVYDVSKTNFAYIGFDIHTELNVNQEIISVRLSQESYLKKAQADLMQITDIRKMLPNLSKYRELPDDPRYGIPPDADAEIKDAKELAKTIKILQQVIGKIAHVVYKSRPDVSFALTNST
ncbi:hypothetical protein WICPIJ_001819 [Wickerhamomyces pijperi]|uniref:Reverse transcriptase Ty1/copia-type domain-containing protein n=1 Tax=Wickerhamomyces pijperi TaxID=599730 RepID=A0A9P8TQF1_WICPI|nr:hypothetical protein WICPIJ_001819 [Wickerhamomyces pijperi]